MHRAGNMSGSITLKQPTLRSVGFVHRVKNQAPIPTVHILPVDGEPKTPIVYKSVSIDHIKALRDAKTVAQSRISTTAPLRPICRYTLLNDGTLNHAVIEAKGNNSPSSMTSKYRDSISSSPASLLVQSEQTIHEPLRPQQPPSISPHQHSTHSELPHNKSSNGQRVPALHELFRQQGDPQRANTTPEGITDGSMPENTIDYSDYTQRMQDLTGQLQKLDRLLMMQQQDDDEHDGLNWAGGSQRPSPQRSSPLSPSRSMPPMYDKHMLSIIAKRQQAQRQEVLRRIEQLQQMTVVNLPIEVLRQLDPSIQDEACSDDSVSKTNGTPSEANDSHIDQSQRHTKPLSHTENCVNQIKQHQQELDQRRQQRNPHSSHSGDDGAPEASDSDFDVNDVDIDGITIKPPKLLALDVGTHYMGVAISDENMTKGYPLEVIELVLPYHKQRVTESPLRNGSAYRDKFVDPVTLANKLNKLRRKHNIVCTVVGLPDAIDNITIHTKIRNFVDNMQSLNGLGPGYQVAFVDEHHTTLEAKNKMLQESMHKQAFTSIVGAGGTRSKRLKINSQTFTSDKKHQIDAEAAAIILDRFLELLPIYGEKYAHILSEEEHIAELQRYSMKAIKQVF